MDYLPGPLPDQQSCWTDWNKSRLSIIFKIALQYTDEEELPNTDSSREGPIEDQIGNSCANSWRLEVCGNTHPPKPKIAEFSQQYRKTCPTHHKLVKSGQLRCSVSLSDSPVSNLDLPSAPTSPQPTYPSLQGSVHWGAVGDLSGAQTPDTSLEAFSGEGLPPQPQEDLPVSFLPVFWMV